MKVFLARIKSWAWVVIALGMAVGAFLIKGLFTKGKASGYGKLLPDPPKKIMEKKAAAEENAMVVRAEVRVKTTQQKETLSQLTDITDGVQRRRELAKFLNDL